MQGRAGESLPALLCLGFTTSCAGFEKPFERVEGNQAGAFDLPALAAREVLDQAAIHPIINDGLGDAGELASLRDSNPFGDDLRGGRCWGFGHIDSELKAA